ncbi:MAG TPA: cyclic nucleotide-binding domain-containing protein [Ilumatobacteraceae bacterium]|jgi:CRP-like cAMP-binding protein
MPKHTFHDHLRTIPMFADLDDDEVDAVARTATELDLPAGKVLMREGEFAHEMFVLVSGTVEVTRGGEHIADIGPGGFAGEMALLAHAQRNSTVVTKTPVDVIHIDGRSFSALLEEVPQIAVKMLPIVAGRVTANTVRHSD